MALASPVETQSFCTQGLRLKPSSLPELPSSVKACREVEAFRDLVGSDHSDGLGILPK